MIFYTFTRNFLKGLFKLAYRHKSILQEGAFCPQGAIIAANHASFLDPPLIAASWPEPIHFLARKTLFEVPLLEPLISNLNAHPLGGASDLNSLKLACKLIQEGKKILIFPEGTRSEDGEIGPFKQGIGMLATRAKCPIIPAYIHGTHEAWPKKNKYPSLFSARTACIFGKPLLLEHFPDLEGKALQQQIAQKLHEEICLLRDQFTTLF